MGFTLVCSVKICLLPDDLCVQDQHTVAVAGNQVRLMETGVSNNTWFVMHLIETGFQPSCDVIVDSIMPFNAPGMSSVALLKDMMQCLDLVASTSAHSIFVTTSGCSGFNWKGIDSKFQRVYEISARKKPSRFSNPQMLLGYFVGFPKGSPINRIV